MFFNYTYIPKEVALLIISAGKDKKSVLDAIRKMPTIDYVPDNDCISRKAVKELMFDSTESFFGDDCAYIIKKELDELPSVIPRGSVKK